MARWIGKDSDIVVLDSPTRGIDIKVKQDIYQLMNQMRKNGKSIIMISEELMELIGMCDRIIIMKDGKLSGELERSPELEQPDHDDGIRRMQWRIKLRQVRKIKSSSSKSYQK